MRNTQTKPDPNHDNETTYRSTDQDQNHAPAPRNQLIINHLVRHRAALLEEEPPRVVRRGDALRRERLEDAAGDEPCVFGGWTEGMEGWEGVRSREAIR